MPRYQFRLQTLFWWTTMVAVLCLPAKAALSIWQSLDVVAQSLIATAASFVAIWACILALAYRRTVSQIHQEKSRDV